MESASQLLYPRYRSLSDAFLYPDGAAVPVTPTQVNTGSGIKTQQHTLPVQVLQAPVHVQAASPPMLQPLQQPILQAVQANENVKKPKKKKRKVKEDPVVKSSGPSNAEEAQLMRNVLGFTATPPATTATPLTNPAHPSSASLAVAQPQAQPQQVMQQAPQVQQPQQAQVQQQQPQQQQQAQVQQPQLAVQQPPQQQLQQQLQQLPQQQLQQQLQQQPQQQPQQPPIQPQQQATFRFGFAGDSPAAAAPTGTPAATQTAAPAAVPAAAQAGVEEALPAPPAGPAPSEYVARRVFVGGMPFSYEVDAIREYWSFCGEIEDLDVMRFPDTGRFKGIAFITYATEEGYLEALKCDGTDLDGQQLRVQKCMSAGAHVPKKKQMAAAPDAVASPAQQQQSPAPKVAGYHVAYVGNLAFEATDAEIQQLFPDCNVTKVRLHTDKNTGKSRGFAHVHFLDEPSLDKALQFNGSPLHRRQVKVSYAQPKKGS
ncbi:TPA: hypothetical protein ACH3X3_007805 [Trebouxia sp. C0006]